MTAPHLFLAIPAFPRLPQMFFFFPWSNLESWHITRHGPMPSLTDWFVEPHFHPIPMSSRPSVLMYVSVLRLSSSFLPSSFEVFVEPVCGAPALCWRFSRRGDPALMEWQGTFSSSIWDASFNCLQYKVKVYDKIHEHLDWSSVVFVPVLKSCTPS